MNSEALALRESSALRNGDNRDLFTVAISQKKVTQSMPRPIQNLLNDKQRQAFDVLVHNAGVLHELSQQVIFSLSVLGDVTSAQSPRKIQAVQPSSEPTVERAGHDSDS